MLFLPRAFTDLMLLAGLLQPPLLPPAAAGRKEQARTPRAVAKGGRPLHSHQHVSSSRSCNSPDAPRDLVVCSQRTPAHRQVDGQIANHITCSANALHATITLCCSALEWRAKIVCLQHLISSTGHYTGRSACNTPGAHADAGDRA